jgi:hypothetical protein
MRGREEEEVTEEEEVAEDSGEEDSMEAHSEEDSAMAASGVSDSVPAASGGLAGLDMVMAMATPASTTTATPAPITTETHGYESGCGEARRFAPLARRGLPMAALSTGKAADVLNARAVATPSGKPWRRRESASCSGPA